MAPQAGVHHRRMQPQVCQVPATHNGDTERHDYWCFEEGQAYRQGFKDTGSSASRLCCPQSLPGLTLFMVVVSSQGHRLLRLQVAGQRAQEISPPFPLPTVILKSDQGPYHPHPISELGVPYWVA